MCVCSGVNLRCCLSLGPACHVVHQSGSLHHRFVSSIVPAKPSDGTIHWHCLMVRDNAHEARVCYVRLSLIFALKKAAVGPKSVGWNITGEGRELALKSQAEFKVYTLWLMLSQSLSMLLSTLAWTVLIWQIMLTLTLCQQNTLILYYGSGSAYIQNCHGPFWFFLFFTKPKISQ